MFHGVGSFIVGEMAQFFILVINKVTYTRKKHGANHQLNGIPDEQGYNVKPYSCIAMVQSANDGNTQRKLHVEKSVRDRSKHA
jgi:hypothetical protein